MRTTQRKGDTAVARAISSFTSFGYDVSLPLTESAAYDLIVDTGTELKRVQVRYLGGKEVDLRQIHSNSQGYVVKKVLENAYDWLYVLRKDEEEFLFLRSYPGRRSLTPRESDHIAKVLKYD